MLVVQRMKQDVMVSPTIKLTLCVFGYKYITGMSIAVAAMKNNTAQWSMFLISSICDRACKNRAYLHTKFSELLIYNIF